MRGDHIKSTITHDAGAYACCSYCGRYSDSPRSLGFRWPCECGEDTGWSGSFKKPNDDAKWSDAPSAAHGEDEVKK